MGHRSFWECRPKIEKIRMDRSIRVAILGILGYVAFLGLGLWVWLKVLDETALGLACYLGLAFLGIYLCMWCLSWSFEIS